MCCISYDSIYLYIDAQADLYARVVAIDAIITQNIALMAAVNQGGGGTYTMYELDDGQVRVRTGYRSLKDVLDGNVMLERMKNLYINKLNGRVTVMRGRSTFRGFPYPWPYGGNV